VRGEALLTAHRGSEAAAEFQKVLDHRGIVVGDPKGTLASARLQMGSAFVLSGDKTKAKTAYQDFLTLWKGPTPTCRSSGKPERNTPVYGNSDSDHLAGSRGMSISTCKRTSREEAAT
jgi:hypothetical protein